MLKILAHLVLLREIIPHRSLEGDKNHESLTLLNSLLIPLPLQRHDRLR